MHINMKIIYFTSQLPNHQCCRIYEAVIRSLASFSNIFITKSFASLETYYHGYLLKSSFFFSTIFLIVELLSEPLNGIAFDRRINKQTPRDHISAACAKGLFRINSGEQKASVPNLLTDVCYGISTVDKPKSINFGCGILLLSSILLKG